MSKKNKAQSLKSGSKAGQKAGSKTAHKSGTPAPVVAKATLSEWIDGARIRTLGLAVAPVILAYAISVIEGESSVKLTILALIVAVALQIAVNFANDYSDGTRGTDNYRVGPQRLVGSGKARPRTVLLVALFFFAIAAAAGLLIVIRTHEWWLLGVGAVCIIAAWTYTGGKFPYGYYGFGEVMAFIFFGPVILLGTEYINLGVITEAAIWASLAMGSFAAAMLLINNARDIEPDRAAGKYTLAVLLGDTASRIIFVILLIAPFGFIWFFWLALPETAFTLFSLLAIGPAILIALMAQTSKELVLVLKLVNVGALLFALGLSYGLLKDVLF
ncbi:MAG: 1,4-dihydroxy-2-naphthoate polyprenyltransferase [Microbacteriaceae bacterium]|nr:1,4-dihydroxy-2-naphthoate polyprenyltransferase [Microbacteriaceae bacterium]